MEMDVISLNVILGPVKLQEGHEYQRALIIVCDHITPERTMKPLFIKELGLLLQRV